MKKITLVLNLLLLGASAYAQNGLEQIIVEKYYVSDANDTMVNSSGGMLPVGSVTYRIYADMLPGYKFQAGYGVPGHELRFETTTLFFNNEDRGATSPTFTYSQAADNTVMLDSWLSVGAACNNYFGVMKSDDDGLGTIVNNDGVLQNADTSAGIPLTVQDGFVAGTPEPVTIVGITTEIAMFDNQNDGSNGPLFTTDNGSWASLYGSIGPDTVANKVLIAQMTTDGTFSFELNIQIGTPSGDVENYVARDPVGNEIVIPSLIFNSLTIGVQDLETTTSGFHVYPNPVNDVFTLEINSDEAGKNNFFRIYDLVGKTVMQQNLTTTAGKSRENVNITNLPQGQYIIEVSLNGKISREKIIKI